MSIKNRVLICILFSMSAYAMDPDVFGGYVVALSNELTAQKREKETKKYLKENKKKESRALEYGPTEVKVLSIGMLATVAIMVFDYMKQ